MGSKHTVGSSGAEATPQAARQAPAAQTLHDSQFSCTQAPSALQCSWTPMFPLTQRVASGVQLPLKFALTVLLAVIDMTQVGPSDTSQSIQLSNSAPSAGVAVSVMDDPRAAAVLQPGPQSIPPPLTEPEPVPPRATVSMDGGASSSKSATTSLSWSNDIVHIV